LTGSYGLLKVGSHDENLRSSLVQNFVPGYGIFYRPPNNTAILLALKIYLSNFYIGACLRFFFTLHSLRSSPCVRARGGPWCSLHVD